MERHDHSVSVVLDKHDADLEKAWLADVKDHEDIKVLKQPFDDHSHLLDYLKTAVPDVVLLDMNSQETSQGYELIQEIREATPRTQIVAVVTPKNPDQAGDALLAGAIGYLYGTKGPQGSAATAIHSAFHQRSVIEGDVATHIWKNRLTLLEKFQYLSRLEQQTLRRLRKGQTHIHANMQQEEWEKHVGHIVLKLHSRKKNHPRRPRNQASPPPPSSVALNTLLTYLTMLCCSILLSYTASTAFNFGYLA